MKLTFGDSKKFAYVHLFEAIKKELDARVIEISGILSSEKNPAFSKKNLVFFCKVVFVFASGFYTRRLKVSDVSSIKTANAITSLI